MGTKNNDFRKMNYCSGFMRLFVAGGGGGTPYDGLYGEASQERVTFFRLQVYKRAQKSYGLKKAGNLLFCD